MRIGAETKRPEKRAKSERGFTLIELLVAVSIVVLLMALLFPALHKSKRQAQAVACQHKLHQWAMLLHQYTSEHEGRCFRFEDVGERTFWTRLIFPDWPQGTGPPPMARCPGLAWPAGGEGQRVASSYDINGWVSDPMFKGPTSDFFWRTVDRAKSPSAVPVFLDCSPGGMAGAARPHSADSPPPYEYSDYGPMGTFCFPQHGTCINSVFMDWSVRKVGLKELWMLKWHREFDTAGPWTKAGGVLPEDWPPWMRQFRDY